MQFISYIVTAAAIIGTIANSLQKRWCFWIWLCTNAFWVVYNAMAHSYSQAILYAFNFAMAIVGLMKWRRNEKARQNAVIEQINQALGIKLYEWQIDYIFGDGEYHDEMNYGRVNGKTLANILKFLFSKGEPLTYDQRLRSFAVPDSEQFMRFAKEDAKAGTRLRIFMQELLRVYRVLEGAGVNLPQKIIFK